jgi:hypothetical protein
MQLGAVAAFAVAVITVARGEPIAAAMWFVVAAVGFLIVLILQRRQ